MAYILTADSGLAGRTVRLPLFEFTSAPATELDESVRFFEKGRYRNWRLYGPDRQLIVHFSVSANGRVFCRKGSVQEEQPFLLQYGYVQLQVHCTAPDGSLLRLASRCHPCDCRFDSDTRNLKKITRYIQNVREPVLQDLLLLPSVWEAPGRRREYSLISGAFGGGREGRIRQVLRIYREQYGFFLTHAETSLRRTMRPAPFWQAGALSPEGLLWSARRGQLHPVPSDLPDPIGRGLFPSGTLTSAGAEDCDLYENRAILGFLETVLRSAERKNTRSGASWGVNTILPVGIGENGTPESGAAEQLRALRQQYLAALPIEPRHIVPLTTLPQMTKRFQEIPAYRAVYSCMESWFRGAGLADPGGQAIMRGYLADTLYEYFCWLQLLTALIQCGFRRSGTPRYTDYGLTNRQMPPFSNIVSLTHSCGAEITAYYEPWIPTGTAAERPSFAMRYGITLFRTGLKKESSTGTFSANGYTPDFLLKIKNGEECFYLVLDAKFRRTADIIHPYPGEELSTMEETIYKYGLCLADAEGRPAPIRAVWLLNGRTDEQEAHPASCASADAGTLGDTLRIFPPVLFSGMKWGIFSLNGRCAADFRIRFCKELSALAMLPEQPAEAMEA